MPKVLIPETSFEEMDVYTQKYNVRYRIITDNQNNLSAWSPIFEVDPEFIFQGGTIESPGEINLADLGAGWVAVTWDSASVYKDVDEALTIVSQLGSYDLWIKWAQSAGANPSDWIYRERVLSTSVNINIPATYIDSNGVQRASIEYLYVEVYRPGRPISRYEEEFEFTQSVTTVSTGVNLITLGYSNGLSTGSEVEYTAASPITGLTSGNLYNVGVKSYESFSLYPTKADALADTNEINLTSTGSGTGSFTGFPFRLYDSVITNL